MRGWRKAPRPIASISAHCCRSPTIWMWPAPCCRPPAWCATMRPTRIWWSPPTRAPQPFPTPPMALPRAKASGWAMPSRRVAVMAMTTRRWASPPRAPGSRCSGISANWVPTCRPRPSAWPACGDMSGDVFGNGMLLSQAVALVAAFDHRHIFLDPTPNIRCRAWPSASACSRCRDRAGTIMTRR
jgi:hypothetical protein